MSFHGDELRRLCRKYPVLRERIEDGHSALPKPTGTDASTRIGDIEEHTRQLESALARLTLENLSLRALHLDVRSETSRN